jgi:hypothetical protein
MEMFFVQLLPVFKITPLTALTISAAALILFPPPPSPPLYHHHHCTTTTITTNVHTNGHSYTVSMHGQHGSGMLMASGCRHARNSTSRSPRGPIVARSVGEGAAHAQCAAWTPRSRWWRTRSVPAWARQNLRRRGSATPSLALLHCGGQVLGAHAMEVRLESVGGSRHDLSGEYTGESHLVLSGEHVCAVTK